MNYKRKRDAKARAELPLSEIIAESIKSVSDIVEEQEVAENVRDVKKAPDTASKRKRHRNS